MEAARSRKVVGELAFRCFDCCETEGAGAHPGEMRAVDERRRRRRRRKNSERWTEKRLRVRTVQRENSPRPPLAPPAVKSNSLTHSGVVSVSGRVTTTKDSNSAAGSVGGFWLGNLSEKTQPPFSFFFLDQSLFGQWLCRPDRRHMQAAE